MRAPLLAVLAGLLAGCVADRTVTTPAEREKSVRPGVNAPYENPNVAEWEARFETESREIFRERERIVADLGLKPGMAVADIGAGTGFFTLLFAQAVGPTGVVYAVDIVPEFVQHIEQRARDAGLTNVRTVLGKVDSVELPADSIDAAFICDTYHHFEYPISTMTSVRQALRPAGAVYLIDFERVEGQSRQWVLDHVRCGREPVIDEMRGCGFELIGDAAEQTKLDENYFLRFCKR